MHRFVTRFSLLPGIAGASIALLVGGTAMHPSAAQAASTTPRAASAATGYDLKVASFNISGVMADKTAPYNWTQRRKKVAQQLTGLNGTGRGSVPHVVALQEANTSNSLRLANKRTQYQDVVAWMNYYAAGKAHYATIDDYSLATRITYDATRLTLVRHGAIRWTSQHPCDGDRYMPYAVFTIKATGHQFFFGSDHLETCSESVRRAQWTQLLQDVPDLAGGLPTVFAGDFNSPRGAASGAVANPTGSVMLPQMAAAGYRDTMGQVRQGRALISDAPAESVVDGNFNSVNKFKRPLGHYTASMGWVGQSVDYIFASSNLRVKQWAMVFDAVKTGADSWSLSGVIPSDHNMIRATITIP